MIESIKIKLTSGKEIELTIEEARLLAAQLQEIFGQAEGSQSAPSFINAPFVQTPNWFPSPVLTTSSTR